MYTFFQITNPFISEGMRQNFGWEFFGRFFPSLVSIGLVVGVVAFFFVLLTGAVQWIASGGDKQKIESARHQITNGLIGFGILLLIFFIIQAINLFFGVNIGGLGVPLPGSGGSGFPSPGVVNCDNDGIAEPSQGEECDRFDFLGETCESVVGTGSTGWLNCSNCVIDTSNCTASTAVDCECDYSNSSEPVVTYNNCTTPGTDPVCSGGGCSCIDACPGGGIYSNGACYHRGCVSGICTFLPGDEPSTCSGQGQPCTETVPGVCGQWFNDCRNVDCGSVGQDNLVCECPPGFDVEIDCRRYGGMCLNPSCPSDSNCDCQN